LINIVNCADCPATAQMCGCNGAGSDTICIGAPAVTEVVIGAGGPVVGEAGVDDGAIGVLPQSAAAHTSVAANSAPRRCRRVATCGF
jgi:hypothetical protein